MFVPHASEFEQNRMVRTIQNFVFFDKLHEILSFLTRKDKQTDKQTNKQTTKQKQKTKQSKTNKQKQKQKTKKIQKQKQQKRFFVCLLFVFFFKFFYNPF